MTKEEALALGIKVMKDIKFEYESKEEIVVIYDAGEKMYKGINTWMIGFSYGYEDYGRWVDANLIIYDDTKNAKSLNYRNGAIDLGYDVEKDKYFIMEKRP